MVQVMTMRECAVVEGFKRAVGVVLRRTRPTRRFSAAGALLTCGAQKKLFSPPTHFLPSSPEARKVGDEAVVKRERAVVARRLDKAVEHAAVLAGVVAFFCCGWWVRGLLGWDVLCCFVCVR